MPDDTIQIAVDGEVFAWPWTGGIARFYGEVLPRMASHDGVSLAVMVGSHSVRRTATAGLETLLRNIPEYNPAWRPWRMNRILAPRINEIVRRAYWRRQAPDVYLPTFYRKGPAAAREVCVVYDLIHEKFPHWFNAGAVKSLGVRRRRAMERAARVVCISECTRRDVLAMFPVPGERCEVVTMGGYVEPRPPYADPIGEPFLLYVGDFASRHKNFAFMLGALHGMQDVRRAYRLVVACSRLPSAGEELAARKALGSDRLTFLTGLSDGEIHGLYACCRAFIYPSLYEGFGIPVIEALSFGAPVVCSNAASLPEAGGDVVHYFDPQSVGGFQLALRDALGADRSPERVHARQTHARQHTWDRCADEFLTIMRDALRD